MRNKIELFCVSALLWGCSTARNSPPSMVNEVLSESAIKIRDLLLEQQYRCNAEGRELYPLLYACDRNDFPAIYLYADERGRLEGIRAFVSGTHQDNWMRIPLDLVFTRSRSDSIAKAISHSDSIKRTIRTGSTIIEFEHSEQGFILRISPQSAIKE